MVQFKGEKCSQTTLGVHSFTEAHPQCLPTIPVGFNQTSIYSFLPKTKRQVQSSHMSEGCGCKQELTGELISTEHFTAKRLLGTTAVNIAKCRCSLQGINYWNRSLGRTFQAVSCKPRVVFRILHCLSLGCFWVSWIFSTTSVLLVEVCFLSIVRRIQMQVKKL